MALPYYKQETNYTCGPASFRMVMASLGFIYDETELKKLLKTSKIWGTLHKSFVEAAEKHKLNYVVKRNTEVNELRKALRKKKLAIVCYAMPPHEIYHYAVVKKVGLKYIYLLDPFLGPNCQYLLTDFVKFWKSDPKHEGDERWFFAIENNKAVN
ncbi:MAG TPA: peptidase C39 family protein [Patescibacteria group bacterium]|nr:peptidase C39 family protein [Patescibacteria group bacterium]